MKTSRAHSEPTDYTRRSQVVGAALTAGVLLLLAFVFTTASSGRDRDRAGGDTMDNEYELSDKEWKEKLTPEQYRILRKKGTERPYTGKYYDHNAYGSYVCAGCTQELFSSSDKYDSGCGWPSFNDADNARIEERQDNSIGMRRTEVVCSRCKGHLGHIFPDGPKQTGLRYCINSAALGFREKSEHEVKPQAVAGDDKLETATLAAGCFWCTEAVYQLIDGVQDVKVGYTGGETKNPTYNEVCSGTTGHAEVAQLTFDPKKVSYSEILKTFWKVHDPTSLNKQGADEGTQYRSAIFYHSDEQKRAAEKSMKKASTGYSRPIVTELVEAQQFYVAENYHQDYYKNNPQAPFCRMVIAPKLKKVK